MTINRRIFLCNFLIVASVANSYDLDEELRKTPPPYLDKKIEELTDEQRREVTQFWDDLNERMIKEMKKILLPEKLTTAQKIEQEKEIRRQVASDVERQKQISELSQDKPFGDPEVVPLEKTDEDRTAWSMEIVSEVNPHFSKTYEDNPDDKLECESGDDVNRPNHSLAHGMRQAYLAVDIALAFNRVKKTPSGNSPAEHLRVWIADRMKTDRLFLKKLQFTNAFQRSGRQSDISKDSNPDKYYQYLLNDQKNFQTAAEKRISTLFKDQDEIDIYKKAITEKFDPDTPYSDLVMLSKIFYTAHTLDLRRLPHFNKDTIRKNVSLQLFERERPLGWMNGVANELWARSGDYLNATGDRDMESKEKSFYDVPVFCAQAHNPKLLISALEMARTKPETLLSSQILNAIDVERDLKSICFEAKKPNYTAPNKAISYYVENICPTLKEKTRSPYVTTDDEKRRIEDLRNTLKTAPYTATEGYLKILLGDRYIEIPWDYTDEMARAITTKNLVAFLYDKKRAGNRPRVENPDWFYINTLVDAAMAERHNRGKIVLYHTTEPEQGVFNDIFSQTRNQIALSGGRDTTALRVLDTGFMKLDKETAKAHMGNFMAAYKNVADSNNDYRDLVLSTNFSIPGSDQQEFADTYNMFFQLKDEKQKISTQPLDYRKFFDYVEEYTGIPGNYDDYRKIIDRFALRCADGNPCRNGRLIQIFIDPEVLVKTSYFSVLLGAPVLKDGFIPELDEPIKLLRTNPLGLKDYLANTKGETISGVKSMHLRPGPLLLHDLQARFFMRPEVMFNRGLIEMKSYWRFSQVDEKLYYSMIRELVNKNLSQWLRSGMPARDDAFVPETVRLKKYAQYIYRGVTGSDAPKAPVVSAEDKLVSLLANDKDQQAASLLEEHVEELRSQTFLLLPTRYSTTREQVSLSELLIKYLLPNTIEKAFQLNIFPGGDETHGVLTTLEEYDQRKLLREIFSLQNPRETARVFNENFRGKKDSSGFDHSREIFIAISEIGNDESVIKESTPLIDLLGVRAAAKTLSAVSKLPSQDRAEVIDAALKHLQQSKEDMWALARASGGIDRILPLFHALKDVDEERKEIMLRVAKFFESDWFFIAENTQKLAQLSTKTLLHVEKSINARPDFRRKISYIDDQERWIDALIVVDKIDPSEPHCPNKSYFRAILTEHNNYPPNMKGRVFVDGDNEWEITEITTPSHGKDLDEVYPQLGSLSLDYNTRTNDPNWCQAMFNNGHAVLLNIYLKRKF